MSRKKQKKNTNMKVHLRSIKKLVTVLPGKKEDEDSFERQMVFFPLCGFE